MNKPKPSCCTRPKVPVKGGLGAPRPTLPVNHTRPGVPVRK